MSFCEFFPRPPFQCFQTETASSCSYELAYDPSVTTEAYYKAAQNRLECGDPGISFDQCMDLGCCYDDSMTMITQGSVRADGSPNFRG